MDFRDSGRDNGPGEGANGVSEMLMTEEKNSSKSAAQTDQSHLIADVLIAAAGAEQAQGAAAPEKAAKKDDSKKVNARRFKIVTDTDRDVLLTEFGKETLQDRYLLPGENYQDLFARVADAYADDQVMPSGCMIISAAFGSCPPPRYYRTAAPDAVFRSAAISTALMTV